MKTTKTFGIDEHGKPTEVTEGPDPASSVEIAQNAKGMPQVTVKIYHENPDIAAEQALLLYKHLLYHLSKGVVNE